MSEVRYEAHPLIFRMRPMATLVVMAIMFVGILFIGAGRVAATMQGYQLMGIALFCIGAVRLYTWYTPSRFEILTVTDAGVGWKSGFLNKRQMDIPLAAVTEVQIEQTPWQRRLYVGDVSIYTTDSTRGRPTLVVRGLPYPERIRELVSGKTGAAATA